MIRPKTEEEIEALRESGRRLAGVMSELKKAVTPGVSTQALNDRAYELVTALGDKPSFLHYQPHGADRPFPASLCISVNDEVVHGIPGDLVLKDGDLVSLDLGLNHNGWHADMAVTVAVGEAGPVARKLMAATEEALYAGIKAARAGNTLGDIGFAIEAVANRNGLGLVRDLGGHGVGRSVHEEPTIANYGKRGTGLKLKAGMVLAIEPMFTLGTDDVDFLPDGYTVKTADGSLAAHFEHTIVVTERGAEVLTKL